MEKCQKLNGAEKCDWWFGVGDCAKKIGPAHHLIMRFYFSGDLKLQRSSIIKYMKYSEGKIKLQKFEFPLVQLFRSSFFFNFQENYPILIQNSMALIAIIDKYGVPISQ